MNFMIVTLIFTAFFYVPTQAALCTSGNPCNLGGYFVRKNGYDCIQKDASTVWCTCPGAAEEEKPCRLCNRVNPAQSVCQNENGKLLACLEDDAYDTGYACLCSDGLLTTDSECDTTVTVTARPTTTVATPGPSDKCLNGGVYVPGTGVCNCPSGYAGLVCADKVDTSLCDRVYCKNGGVCAIRNTNGPYEGVCLCRYGTFGEYCELNGTLGFCSSGSCMNGGVCRENLVGSTRHAYCYCQGGYDGPKCENRYFICPDVGVYPDLNNFNQGKYFNCTNVGGTLRAEQKSCPRGLRYNSNLKICTY